MCLPVTMQMMYTHIIMCSMQECTHIIVLVPANIRKVHFFSLETEHIL